MRKKLIIIFSVALLVYVLGLVISDYKTDNHVAVERLETIMENSLFHVWTSYDEIVSHLSDPLTIDVLKELIIKLSFIEVHSVIIDEAVGQYILNESAKNFLIITRDIEKDYEQMGQFTTEHKAQCKHVIDEVKNIIPLIHETYYVHDVTEGEGSKPTLEINDPTEIKALNARLQSQIK